MGPTPGTGPPVGDCGRAPARSPVTSNATTNSRAQGDATPRFMMASFFPEDAPLSATQGETCQYRKRSSPDRLGRTGQAESLRTESHTARTETERRDAPTRARQRHRRAVT